MGPFTVEVRIPESKYARLMLLRYLKSSINLYILAVTIVVGAIDIYSHENSTSTYFFTGAAILIGLPIVIWGSAFRLYRRSFLKSGVNYTISEEGLASATNGISSKVSWNNVTDTQQIGGYLLLYYMRSVLCILPVSLLTPDQIIFIRQKIKGK